MQKHVTGRCQGLFPALPTSKGKALGTRLDFCGKTMQAVSEQPIKTIELFPNSAESLLAPTPDQKARGLWVRDWGILRTHNMTSSQLA